MPLVKRKISPVGEAGQVLLIVILVIIVALTVGISLASRTITNLRSATEEVESQKALAAAEAGIERAIQGNVPINISSTGLGNNSSYTATYSAVESSGFALDGGNVIPKDEGADIWFVEHDSNGDPDYSSMATYSNYLHLYWGDHYENCISNKPAAIQAIVITRSAGGIFKSYRYAYDSCSSSRANNFTPTEGISSYTIGGVTYGNRTPEAVGASHLAEGITDIVMIRVVPIYKDTVIGVRACNHNGDLATCTTLPLQGYSIDSLGTSGEANRKIRVFKGWPQTYLPYLSYGLFVAEGN